MSDNSWHDTIFVINQPVLTANRHACLSQKHKLAELCISLLTEKQCYGSQNSGVVNFVINHLVWLQAAHLYNTETVTDYKINALCLKIFWSLRLETRPKCLSLSDTMLEVSAQKGFVA